MQECTEVTSVPGFPLGMRRPQGRLREAKPWRSIWNKVKAGRSRSSSHPGGPVKPHCERPGGVGTRVHTPAWLPRPPPLLSRAQLTEGRGHGLQPLSAVRTGLPWAVVLQGRLQTSRSSTLWGQIGFCCQVASDQLGTPTPQQCGTPGFVFISVSSPPCFLRPLCSTYTRSVARTLCPGSPPPLWVVSWRLSRLPPRPAVGLLRGAGCRGVGALPFLVAVPFVPEPTSGGSSSQRLHRGCLGSSPNPRGPGCGVLMGANGCSLPCQEDPPREAGWFLRAQALWPWSGSLASRKLRAKFGVHLRKGPGLPPGTIFLFIQTFLPHLIGM